MVSATLNTPNFANWVASLWRLKKRNWFLNVVSHQHIKSLSVAEGNVLKRVLCRHDSYTLTYCLACSHMPIYQPITLLTCPKTSSTPQVTH